MASKAYAIFETMGDATLDIFGVAATYSPSGSADISLMVWLRDATELQIDNYDAQTYKGITFIEAMLSDTGKEPDVGETFDVDGTEYEVFTVISNDGRSCVCAVKS
jgi:hypothetical protein